MISVNRKRGERRIPVRSGAASPEGRKRVRVVVVSNSGPRTLLWLGGGPHDGIAWVSGEKTLRAIRDALDEALGPERTGT